MSKLKNYINDELKNNRIFTREDIKLMSSDEYKQNEKAIFSQLRKIGIPINGDMLRESLTSGDVVYVHEYTRSDGTKVKAHYRSKQENTRFAQEQPNVLKGKISNNDSQELTAADKMHMVKKIFDNEKIKISGIANKMVLDYGVDIYNCFMHENDAKNFWHIASKPLGIKNNNYINKNSKLFNGIDDLGNEYSPYKKKIKEKVKSQFGKEDVPGIVFHENSSVANAIIKSKELETFFLKNINIIKSGKEVSGSLRFVSDRNLYHAFGKIDILSAKLTKDTIDVILLDTYDFNPNEKNLIVRMGYSVQEAKLLNPYFTIVRCKYKL